MPGSAAPRPSTPVRPLVVLFDGHCRFCVAGSRRLARLCKPGSIELIDAQDPASLARFPHLTHAAATRALQLVEPSGRVHSGAAAIAAALNTRPFWRLFTWLYHVPGLHALTDSMYAFVARNRYRIAGRATSCDSGACSPPNSATQNPPPPASPISPASQQSSR